MKKNLLVLLCVLLFSVNSFAQPLYKIIDEKGRVSYSEKPPVGGDAQVESMSIEGDGKTSITQKGAYEFCGDIELPSVDVDRYAYESIGRLQDEWKDRLKNISAKRTKSKYSGSYQTSEHAKRNKEVRDLRCAIEWAGGMEGELGRERETRLNSVQRIKSRMSKLERDSLRKCGSEPREDVRRAETLTQWENWDRCVYEYDKIIRNLRDQLRSESRSLRDL